MCIRCIDKEFLKKYNRLINSSMLNEHISKHHDRINLKIDIEKLGKAYLDFKYHLGFRTDDKTKFDFNAICVNRIPGMRSLFKVVMFVVYIGLIQTLLTTKNKD